jgi:hypothetical protein
MTGDPLTHQEALLDERRYRTGRGGYDPEVAAQLARAKYAFRQRVVLGLALGALVTVVLAYAVSGLLWWVHAMLDVAIVGYLCYLRRQVRIEEEVRQRRAARLAAPRTRISADVSADFTADFTATAVHDVRDVPVDVAHEREEPVADSPARPAVEPVASHPTAVAVDFDDEDPIFDELRPSFEPPYRRAVGE